MFGSASIVQVRRHASILLLFLLGCSSTSTDRERVIAAGGDDRTVGQSRAAALPAEELYPEAVALAALRALNEAHEMAAIDLNKDELIYWRTVGDRIVLVLRRAETARGGSVTWRTTAMVVSYGGSLSELVDGSRVRLDPSKLTFRVVPMDSISGDCAGALQVTCLLQGFVGSAKHGGIPGIGEIVSEKDHWVIQGGGWHQQGGGGYVDDAGGKLTVQKDFTGTTSEEYSTLTP